MNDGGELDDYLDVLLPDGKVYRPEDGTYTFDEFKRLHNACDAIIRLDANIPSFAEFAAAAAK